MIKLLYKIFLYQKTRSRALATGLEYFSVLCNVGTVVGKVYFSYLKMTTVEKTQDKGEKDRALSYKHFKVCFSL